MAVSFSRPDPSSSAAVSAATFPTVRRGFDPEEVRDFLRMVSVELARVQERERYLERELHTARTAVRAVPEPLDEDMVTEMLGEEAARVLATAREAAASIRSKAEDGASRLLREAQDEAAAVREQAELEAVRRRQDAAHDAEAELEGARQQGRDMVEEARQYREKVLTDLNRRRELARQQIAHLLSGRDRLIGAYERARVVATDIISEITDVGDEPDEYVNLAAVTGPVPITIPRVSASGAAFTSASQRRPEPPVMLGRDAAAPTVTTPAPSAPPAVSIVPPLQESTVSVITQADADAQPDEAVGDSREANLIDGQHQAEVEVEVEAEAEGTVVDVSSATFVGADSDSDFGAGASSDPEVRDVVAPSQRMATSLPVAVDVPAVVEVGLAPVVALFGQREELRHEGDDIEAIELIEAEFSAVDADLDVTVDHSNLASDGSRHASDRSNDSDQVVGVADGDTSASDEAARAQTSPIDLSASSVDSLFAKLRESRAQKIASDVFHNEQVAQASTAPVEAHVSDSSSASKPLAVVEDRVVDDVFQRTAEANAASEDGAPREDPLVVLTARIARSLKRVLADEQNDVLNVLRRKDPVRSIDLLVPWESEHVDQYVLSIADDVVGGLDEATQWVSATIVMPLRRELESAIVELAGDNARLANEVRAFYRDLRTQVIDETAQAIASACAVTSSV